MAFASIDGYISSCPDDIRPILESIRQAIHKAVPGCGETISYGIPTMTIDGKYLVYFAAWKRHVSVYPIPTGDQALERELEAYRTGKGTLRFPLQHPIPYDLIGSVAAQLAANR